MHTNKLNILILILFFCGCTVKDSDDDSVAYISDAQFNFHQDVNMLYVSAKILPEAEGKILDNVIVDVIIYVHLIVCRSRCRDIGL